MKDSPITPIVLMHPGPKFSTEEVYPFLEDTEQLVIAAAESLEELSKFLSINYDVIEKVVIHGSYLKGQNLDFLDFLIRKYKNLDFYIISDDFRIYFKFAHYYNFKFFSWK